MFVNPEWPIVKLMETNGNRLSEKSALEDAKHLHLIENNPLSVEETAMFEMFERENWSADRRRAYILGKIQKSGETTAAE